MLGHHNVSHNHEPIPSPHPFEYLQKKVASRRITKQWLALETAESDEMEITSTVESMRMILHGQTVQRRKEGSL